jgi:hypothetical protein
MKTILSWSLHLSIPLGICAQTNGTAEHFTTDFSNPSALFSQVVAIGQLAGSNANPISYPNFEMEHLEGAVAIDLAKGPFAVGAQLGTTGIGNGSVFRPSFHFKFRQEWSGAQVKGLQWLAEVSLPTNPRNYFLFENHLFALQGSLSIGLQAMADVPIQTKWRLNPYARIDMHTSNPWAQQQINLFYNESGWGQQVVLDAEELQFKQWDARIGTFVTNHYSTTHFVQLNAWFNYRTIHTTNEPTQARWGDVSLNELFGFQVLYHSALWEDLMGFVGLGATTRNVVTSAQGALNFGWQGKIFAGLRWGW